MPGSLMWGSACNTTTDTVASCKWIRQKTAMGQAKQDPDLPSSASNVLGKVQSHLCLTEWMCRRGKSTLVAACLTQKIMFCNLCCTLRLQVRFSAGSPSALAWSLYKCAVLWRAVYGSSATERLLGTIVKRWEFLGFYLVAIWPKLLKAM